MTTHSLTTLSSSTATRLTPLGIHSGLDITVQNVHASATVYIGGEGVTPSDYGYRLLSGTAVSFELPGRDALYAISSANDTQVAVIKTGLESGN